MSESLNYTPNRLIQKTKIHLETELVPVFLSESINSLNRFVHNTDSFRIETSDHFYEQVDESYT